MRDSFSHKLIMTLLASLAAAGLLWFYRHIVAQSIYEMSNEGWKEMFHATPAKRR